MANDPDLKVRRAVVNACLTMVDCCGTRIDVHTQYPKIIEFMLYCIRDKNAEIALEATVFWKIITAEHLDHICEVVLLPYLPQIYQTLLTR